MTITALKVTEKKGDEIPLPEVVTVDGMLPVEDEQNESSEPKHAVVATTVSGPFRKRHPVKRFVILLGIVLMTSLIVGCISLYKHLANASKVVGPGETYQYIARCGVDDDGFTDPLDADAAMNGEFELQVEINDEFEKILVPAIGDTRNATILHDFNVNMTAIIDEEKGFCYIINLNRSLALPPHDFRDLLIKLKVEYYIPDSEVFHENYHAVTPPIQDLTPFGIHIKEECSKLNLYRLVKIGEPVAMSKRPACDIQGEKYCLGEAGKKTMMCFNIVDCL